MGRLPQFLAALSLGLCSWWGAPASVFADSAEHPVELDADIDGDGATDQLAIDELGGIGVTLAGGTKQDAWTPLASSGKVLSGSIQLSPRALPGGKRLLLAKAKLRGLDGRRRREAAILLWSPGQLEALWRNPIGSTRNSNQQTVVSMEGEKLFLYEEREGVFRCDGKAAHLQLQRFDLKRKTFVPVERSARVAPDAELLRSMPLAEEQVAQKRSPLWFRPRGASSIRGVSQLDGLLPPVAVSDGDPTTAWIEGSAGVGHGDYLTFTSQVGPVELAGLRIQLGSSSDRKLTRPTRVAILLGQDKSYWATLTDDSSEQWIQFPKPQSARCVTVVIDQVSPKSAERRNKGDSAIAELGIYSVDELGVAGPAQAIARHLAKGKLRGPLAPWVERMGEEAEAVLVEALEAAKGLKQRKQLLLALASKGFALDELAKGLAEDGLRPQDYRKLARPLVSTGDGPVASLARALSDSKLSVEAVQRLGSALVAIKSEASTRALVNELGKGNEERRRALARLIGSRGPGAVTLAKQLPSTSSSPAKRADLLHAIAAGPRREGTESVATPLSTLLDDSGLGFEERYRLFQAALHQGGPALASRLADLYAKLSQTDGVESLALRELVLEHGQGPVLRELQLAALGEADAGLRKAALRGLATANAPGTRASIAAHLVAEPWPELRREAVAGLQGHCDEQGITEGLRERVLHDDDADVARTALAGLRSCSSERLFALFAGLVDDDARPLDLRLFAARSLGSEAHQSDVATVLELYRRYRRLALAKSDAAQVASALTVALADIGSPKAITLLEKTAADPAFPQLQAAAISALAQSCAPTSRGLFRRLQQSQDPGVALAARRAGSRCR